MNELVKLPKRTPKAFCALRGSYCFAEFFLESPGAHSLQGSGWVGGGGRFQGTAPEGSRQIRDTVGQLPGLNKSNPVFP